MAERKPSGTKLSMLHGIVIRSTVESGRIMSIQMPEPDESFIVIAARDIPGTNRVKVHDSVLPLFVTSRVAYKGQPILALFGPDNEAVETRAKEIKITYELPQVHTEVSPDNEATLPETVIHDEAAFQYPAIPDYTWGWGDAKTVMNGKKLVEKRYEVAARTTDPTKITRVFARKKDDALIITAPTQWPFHLKETISTVTLIPKKQIIVEQEEYYAPYDEKLILPSFLAAIVSIVTTKTGLPSEICSRFPVYMPSMVFERKTALETNGKPVAETIEVTVNQGAETLFSDELCRQIVAGLVPMYPLQAFAVTIKIIQSASPPAHFYGSLGYSEAVCSTEQHCSALAEEAGVNPANWRLRYYSESLQRSKVLSSQKLSGLRDAVSSTVILSDFQRKYAVYEMQRANTRRKLSTFLNYARGIGIACAATAGGFSSQFKAASQYAFQLCLTAGDKVVINTSFSPTKESAAFWKSIIATELGIEEKGISFIAENDPEMVDSGPDVLSRDVVQIPDLIEKACEEIKAKRFVEPLPLTATVSARLPVSGRQVLFTSDGWVVVVLELDINTITLQPVVRTVWTSLLLGTVFNASHLRSEIRHIVVSTLLQNGALLSTEAGKEFTINIDIKQKEHTPVTSVQSALKGAVSAAFNAAITQAFGQQPPIIPLTEDTVISLVRRDS